MKNIIKILLVAAIAVPLSGCNDFLSKKPEANKGEIETVEQLEGLLAENNFEGEGRFDNNRTSMFSGDCFDITPEYYKGGLKTMDPELESMQVAMWEMKYVEDANQMMSKWYQEYQVIYTANLILEYVDKVSGSAERKEAVRLKAHLVRAYSYLELAQYYCLPYGEGTLDEPGLPIKRQTSYEEDMRRTSVRDTYAFIEQDVLEAVKLTEPLFVNGRRMSWKETGATANALAARLYLAMHNYGEALKYAREALKYGDDVADFNTEISQTPGMMAPSLNIRNIDIFDIPQVERAYYYKLTTYLFQMMWFIPSDRFLALFDRENPYDLRYKYFYWENGQDLYLMASFMPPFEETIPIWMSYDLYMSTGPNVAEMMLTEAECLARTGKVQEAMTVLNDFRKYRFDTAAPASVVNLSAADQQTAVKYVLEERMREFPFTLRWNDIRRINFNDDPADDVTVTRRFYTVGRSGIDDGAAPVTYTLKPGDRNYAVAIPNGEIVSSAGAIQQNTY